MVASSPMMIRKDFRGQERPQKNLAWVTEARNIRKNPIQDLELPPWRASATK
jgi:hypothetical protein